MKKDMHPSLLLLGHGGRLFLTGLVWAILACFTFLCVNGWGLVKSAWRKLRKNRQPENSPLLPRSTSNSPRMNRLLALRKVSAKEAVYAGRIAKVFLEKGHPVAASAASRTAVHLYRQTRKYNRAIEGTTARTAA